MTKHQIKIGTHSPPPCVTNFFFWYKANPLMMRPSLTPMGHGTTTTLGYFLEKEEEEGGDVCHAKGGGGGGGGGEPHFGANYYYNPPPPPTTTFDVTQKNTHSAPQPMGQGHIYTYDSPLLASESKWLLTSWRTLFLLLPPTNQMTIQR